MEERQDGVLASDGAVPKQAPKTRKKRKAAQRFKVTRFDKDLVKLIHAGTTNLKDACQQLGVDYDSARSRALAMAEKKWLVTDPSHADVFRLGLEGYNQFASVVKPKAKSLAAKASGRSPPKAAVADSEPVPPLEDVDSLPSASNAVDLADLLRRGAPKLTSGEPTDYGLPAPSPSLPVPPVTQKNAAESTVCELCRAPFKLSVKNLEGAKYAHCFCGAAYHKDCYHALVEGGGRCARCGRKLSLILDRHADEALKSVKDLFD
ncbi:hypothetical protein HY572_00450 [Candidatus Micrarchaeota archaeon]|nr:hypothetical protein [Candidatus Micrarchaeota archaeon]